uniref:Secreted protein n=1 Tax=Thraustotheca clavata TaxID=74557 RepID=A0A0A7CLX7_9STRA|nr:secreted protein [Thraustotheca clavata]
MWCSVFGVIILTTCVARHVLTLFDNYNYQGRRLDLSIGNNDDVKREWQNRYEFVGYFLESLGGEYMIWNEDTPDMGKLWNNYICSYIVRENYESTDFQSGNVNMVLLTPGYKLILYDNLNQTGNFTRYSYDTPGLNIRALSYSMHKIPITAMPVVAPSLIAPLTPPTHNDSVIITVSIFQTI